MRNGAQLLKIPEAGGIFGEQNKVMVRPPLPPGLRLLARLLSPVPFCHDIRFHTDDRLHPGFLRLLVELNGAEHHAVVGQRDRRHIVLHRGMDQILNAARGVKQTVVRMIVKMDELSHCLLLKDAEL